MSVQLLRGCCCVTGEFCENAGDLIAFFDDGIPTATYTGCVPSRAVVQAETSDTTTVITDTRIAFTREESGVFDPFDPDDLAAVATALGVPSVSSRAKILVSLGSGYNHWLVGARQQTTKTTGSPDSVGVWGFGLTGYTAPTATAGNPIRKVDYSRAYFSSESVSSGSFFGLGANGRPLQAWFEGAGFACDTCGGIPAHGSPPT